MIKVKHCNGLFLVWHPGDAICLRKEHHIVGNLVGAWPEFPRQHNDYGLPLVLMLEEVRLLLKHSLATVVDTNHSSDYYATDDCKAYYRQLKEDQYEEINSRMKEERKAEIETNLGRIVQGKMKKLKMTLDESSDEFAAFQDKIRAELHRSIKDLPKDASGLLTPFLVHVPYPNVVERPYELPPLAASSLDSLKFAVYEHFWAKGYHLTDGIKFGAHFLAYDSDPIAFHAKFIIMCCPDDDSVAHFQNTLLQAYGRLGKNVRKNVIIAHYQDNSPEPTSIAYKHVQWNTIGL